MKPTRKRKPLTERQRFGRWINRTYPGWTLEQDGVGYEESWVDGAWAGWQAAKRTKRAS